MTRAPTAVACLFLAALSGAAGEALAAPPDAAKLRQAAEHFDAGVAARKAGDWERSASSFEAADAAAPSPQALRNAIRMRVKAGHGSRAATLAALALERYPDDAETKALAGETLESLEPTLHRISVSCASPCVLAVGRRVVPGEASTRATVFVEPGEANLSASFFGGASDSASVDAKAGGRSVLRLEPGGEAAPGAAEGDSPGAGTDGSEGLSGEAGEGSKPGEPVGEAAGGKGVPKGFVVAGAVVTAALGGVTIWSGLDTQSNPGPDAVREGCVGQGEACPLYQDGLARQTRTNVLLGATIGAAAVTGVLALLADWGGGPGDLEVQAAARSARKKRASGAWIRPEAALSPGAALLGARGRF